MKKTILLITTVALTLICSCALYAQCTTSFSLAEDNICKGSTLNFSYNVTNASSVKLKRRVSTNGGSYSLQNTYTLSPSGSTYTLTDASLQGLNGYSTSIYELYVDRGTACSPRFVSKFDTVKVRFNYLTSLGTISSPSTLLAGDVINISSTASAVAGFAGDQVSYVWLYYESGISTALAGSGTTNSITSNSSPRLYEIRRNAYISGCGSYTPNILFTQSNTTTYANKMVGTAVITELEVYPTQVIKNLSIKAPEPIRYINIIDNSGRLMFSAKDLGNITEVDCEVFPVGLYYVQVQSGATTMVVNITKE